MATQMITARSKSGHGWKSVGESVTYAILNAYAKQNVTNLLVYCHSKSFDPNFYHWPCYFHYFRKLVLWPLYYSSHDEQTVNSTIFIRHSLPCSPKLIKAGYSSYIFTRHNLLKTKDLGLERFPFWTYHCRTF
jgi:hypothetical protein